MKFPDEMQKLRTMLDNMGIKWHDESASLDSQDEIFMIYRTKFKIGGVRYSVVCGFCTYGGDKGLLEMMVGDADPTGWLTAEDIIGVVQEKIMRV